MEQQVNQFLRHLAELIERRTAIPACCDPGGASAQISCWLSVTLPGMPIAGAYIVRFSGPKEAEGQFVAALTRAELAAEPCSPMYTHEAHLSWVHVLAHEGGDGHPSVEFQQGVNAKAAPIATAFGFSHRSQGFVV
jgi:hypothetical protein